MKNKLIGTSVLMLSILLVGCAENSEGENENVIETSGEAHVHDHDHGHAHDHDHQHEVNEEEKKIHQGYFEDEQVKDRPLSDWAGDWQSVYPLLLDGTLDEVFEHKASNDSSRSFEEIKNYYTTGYKTSIDRLVIEENVVTFYDGDKEYKGEFEYDGYEILTYEKGNRGVRFIFKHVGDEEGVPQYIQFSDHKIAPEKADHFHIYMGDDRDALLNELSNWPTYFPSEMDGHTIVHEMIAH